MRQSTRRHLLTLAMIGITTFSAETASAHRAWLLPSATSLSGEDPWVTVDAAVSNDLFYADHMPLQTTQIRVTAPDGTPGEIKNAASGRYRSVFDVQLTKPGTWMIGSDSATITGSFMVDGVAHRVGRPFGRPGVAPGGPGGPGGDRGGGDRPGSDHGGGDHQGPAFTGPPVAVEDIPANATAIKLTETDNRNAIYVTSGAPTTKVITPTGKGLEFAPVTHPDELVSDSPARFRFMIDGKPAAGLKLSVIPGGKRYRDAEGEFTVVTDAAGLATIKWPGAGMFWLNVTATDSHPTLPRATERRMSFTTTLEVMAP